MTDDRFDDVDRALAAGLGGLAPSVPNADDTLESVRPRLRRARTRARAAKAGGALVALLAVGSAAAVVTPHSGRTHVTVSSGSSEPGSTRPVPSSSTSTSTTTLAPPRSHAVHTPSTSTSTLPETKGTTGPGLVPSTTPGSTVPRGGPGPSDHSGPGRGGSTTTVAPTAPSDVQTYRATGGSITVRLVGNAASLATVSPEAGFGSSVHDGGPSRIEVRFTRAGDEVSRIDVQVENGRLVRVDHGG